MVVGAETKLKWTSADDIEGLEVLANEVLPQLTSSGT